MYRDLPLVPHYEPYLRLLNGWQSLFHHALRSLHTLPLFSLALDLFALLMALHAVDALRGLCKHQIVDLGVALDAPEAVGVVRLVTYNAPSWTR